MIVIYDTPARPWAFGPLIGTDIVTRQAEALVQRYDLLDALGAGGPTRRDLDPSSRADDRLREVIARQLVPWVDYIPEGHVSAGDRPAASDEGWPIPAGVRLEALCYSPWLDALRASDGTIGGKYVFALPTSAAEFAATFHARSGLSRNLGNDICDGFRLTPQAAGEVAMDIRGDIKQPPPRAFLLLVSRHFEEALAADARLGAHHPALDACGFNRPSIVAFQRLAELERAGAIVREVNRHAHAGEVLRPLLEAANTPDFIAASKHPISGVAWSQDIADALARDPTLLRLCEYLAVGTDVLASWRNAVIADRGTFHISFRPTAALGHGLIDSDITTALAAMIDVRTAFLSAFRTAAKAGPGSRHSTLGNDILFKWYGLTGANDNLGAALVADFHGARPAGRPRKAAPLKRVDDATRRALASVIAQLGRDGRPQSSAGPGRKANTGKNSVGGVRTGAWLSRLYLPGPGQPGGAARGDETMWRDRYRDQWFWEWLQNWDETATDKLDVREKDAASLRSAMRDFGRLVAASVPWARSALIARVLSDFASAVSPIAVNPAHARAIKRLATANAIFTKAQGGKNAEMSKRRLRARAELEHRGLNKPLGLRRIEGIEGFTKGWEKKRPR